ncbi:hypothetical protein FHS01_001950 [Longimicrobium terrae]|uniref:Uncharacterized protein n=1 Tax=Longimicrobium terrae TaxID=1639882 RepID=A0A841GSQ3_9BACT|nr:hypothetical protein [Longimicrobium terrae]MBB6070330.1 hypothetical protein [Longimicrobium terrae]
MTGFDWRAVPIETVRAWVRDEADASSLRLVARRAGLGRTTLKKFIGGETSPHPRIRRSLTLLYLSSVPSVADAALDVLTANVPDQARAGARGALLELLARLHTAEGVNPPSWAVEGAGTGALGDGAPLIAA